ncbi:hypothetical protein ACNAN0_04430 [Agrilactobacillus fermenti]|uniref:hypothetical protein n=1 Tax=Agrilactobacillus fermenti TaxID=2586909 RepID=UPI003A5BB787
MWPDTDDNDTIYLSYDGYITDPNKLSSYNMPTDEPIILHVENTIKPTDDQQQMAMSEVVTNPKTIYGNQTNTKDLSNLYFTREYDTALGHPNNDDGSPDDGVPIRYSGIGTSGPRNGKIEGLVIRPSDLTNSDYKYQVAFNFNSDFAPDGWMGTTFTTYPTGGSMQNGAAVQPNAFMVSEDGTGIFYKKHPDTGSQVWSIFNKADDVGMANTDPDKANTIAFGSKTKNNAYDTSILMKWSPNYVGDFKPGKNVVMGFNADLGTALAPGLEADKSYLRMDNTRNEVPVSLQDLDSTNVSVRYTIDTPLDSKHITGDDSDGSKKLLSATGVSSDYTPYTGKITDTSDLQKLQTPQEGGHTLYLYAVDDTGYVSRIRTITVNKPIYFNLQATVQATDTSDKLIPDTKVQQYYAFAGDSYNYIDGTKNLFDPATTDWTYATAGNAPDTLTVDDHNYKKTGTPSNASGSLTPTQTDGVTAKKPITINYHYIDQGYLKLTVPNVNFGQHKIGMPGQYYAETLDDPKGTKGDNQGQLSFENTTPNKNLSIYLKATKPLTNMQTHQSIPDGLAFQPAKSGTTAESITDNSVLIYKTSSDTSAVISDTWKTNGVYTAGPVLTVTDKNDGVGQGTYTGELEWIMTTSTN